MTNDSVAVVRRYLEALRRMDTAAMFSELDEEVILKLPIAPPGLPRQIVGRRAFSEFFGPIAAGLWKEITFPTIEVRAEADPERVVATYTSQGTFTNEEKFKNSYVNLFRIRNGKISETIEFFDPLAVARGLQP